MKATLIVIATVLSSLCFGQVDTINPKMLQFEYDSCDVAIWDIYSKETSLPSDQVYASRKLAQAKLTSAQHEELSAFLKDPKSYDGTRANLTHHDIEITFYRLGKEIVKVEISAMTGNVDIQNSSNGYYFRNNCSKSFGEYFISLLNEYNIIEQVEYDEIDIEGLN